MVYSEKALEILLDQPGQTAQEIAEKTGIKLRDVFSVLARHRGALDMQKPENGDKTPVRYSIKREWKEPIRMRVEDLRKSFEDYNKPPEEMRSKLVKNVEDGIDAWLQAKSDKGRDRIEKLVEMLTAATRAAFVRLGDEGKPYLVQLDAAERRMAEVTGKNTPAPSPT